MDQYKLQQEYILAKTDADQCTTLGPTEGTISYISRVRHTSLELTKNVPLSCSSLWKASSSQTLCSNAATEYIYVSSNQASSAWVRRGGPVSRRPTGAVTFSRPISFLYLC